MYTNIREMKDELKMKHSQHAEAKGSSKSSKGSSIELIGFSSKEEKKWKQQHEAKKPQQQKRQPHQYSSLLPPSSVTTGRTSAESFAANEVDSLAESLPPHGLENSRTWRKKHASVVESSAYKSFRDSGRTITGGRTSESSEEEARILSAAANAKNDQHIQVILNQELKQILSLHNAFLSTRDVHEQWSYVKKLVSQVAQFIDKVDHDSTQVLLYTHLLSKISPHQYAPHKSASTHWSRLIQVDPHVMLEYFQSLMQKINNVLHDFTQTSMHGPGWMEQLNEIIRLLKLHDTEQRQYFLPFLHSRMSHPADQIAYGTAWSEYALCAKKEPQPTIIRKEVYRMATFAGLKPLVLARAFEVNRI